MDLRVFSSSSTYKSLKAPCRLPLLDFTATSASSLHVCHLFTKGRTSTVYLVQKIPRVSFSTLQHFQQKEPFFSHSSFKKRPDRFALLSGSPILGFGYPLDGSIVLFASVASFSSQRSWASPSKAFLLPGDRRRVSSPLSARALPYQTSTA